MSVDLPEPDAPMMATNSPRSIRRLTPRSASTTTSPMRYDFARSSTSITTSDAGMAGLLRVSEAEGRARRLAAGGGSAGLADDHALPRRECPAGDLHARAVVEPERDRHRLGPAVAQHEHLGPGRRGLGEALRLEAERLRGHRR